MTNRPTIPDSPVKPFPIIITNTTVIPGFGRGSSEIGIPTANIPITDTLQALDTGVYFGFVKLSPRSPENNENGTNNKESVLPKTQQRLDGKSTIELTYGQSLQSEDLEVLPMVMSLGWNPYFKNDKKACELHIMHDFKSGDFYGCQLSFNILGYLRPELDYASMEALILDIKEDIRLAIEKLQAEEYIKYKDQLL